MALVLPPKLCAAFEQALPIGQHGDALATLLTDYPEKGYFSGLRVFPEQCSQRGLPGGTGPLIWRVLISAEVPELMPGAIVVMDNLSSHKGPNVRAMIQDAGARLLYLPPYSPDFNPIQNAFAKLKTLLRKAAKRTVDGLWNTIGQLVDTFTPSEC